MGVRRPRRPRRRGVHLGRRGPARRAADGQHLGRARLPLAQHRRERLPADRTGRQLPAQRLRPVRHGRQRLGVDRRLVDQPAPGRRRLAVLRAGGTRAAATSSRAYDPAQPQFRVGAQGGQGRLPPVRRLLLPALPAGRPPAADDRHRHEPRRLPLRAPTD